MRVAKKREKHLEEEERAEKKIEKDGTFCEADLEEKTEEATDKQMQKEERQQTKAKMDMQRMQKLMEQYERMMQEAMKELERLDDMDELSEDDKLVVSRARKVQRFLSQPFFVAGQFTGLEGKYVPIAETIRSFKEILEGKHDEVPESYFLNAGSIDDVLARMK